MSTFYIITIILSIPSIIGLMKIFEKAGYSQWLALIPFYNAYIWVRIIEKPLWWLIFAFLPFINVFMLFLMIVETAKTFNKNLLWEQALSAVFPFVYLPYLGFSSDEKYQNKEDRPKFKKSIVREWTDAIIFAIFAATIIRTFVFEAYTIPTPSMEKSLLVGDYLFVSKLAFGPKSPNTPLAFPFVHHTLPMSATKKSYLEWIKLPYHRYFGFREIKNNDIVVFNYPDGDTVALNAQNQSYYALVRHHGWKNVNNPRAIIPGSNGATFGKVVARPVDKRENYIKRCIGIAGDSLQIIDQQVYINGVKAKNSDQYETQYFIVGKTKEVPIAELQELGLANDDIASYIRYLRNGNYKSEILRYHLPLSTYDTLFSEKEKIKISLINLSTEAANKLRNHPQVEKLVPLVYKSGIPNPSNDIFPHSPENYVWNQDNYGPIYIPQKGATVDINIDNIVLYKRIIGVYENNKLEIKGNQIYINDELAISYTFNMNYYWMMGDNRHNSADSRFWGFVPEDHVVGTPSFIWLSTDKDKKGFSTIRWDRVFMIPE